LADSTVDTSWIEPPLELDDAAAGVWAGEADVVVVGLGLAGVCAALEARERGLEVIVVERFDGGGASAISGGIYYGGGTAVQQEAGVQDTTDDLFAYLEQELGGAVSRKTVRAFADQSADNLEWLRAHGVQYKGVLYEPKTAYPPDGYYLYYSGNERLKEFAARARPAARGHRAYADDHPGGASGGVMMRPLLEAVRRSGAQLITHAPVVRLVTSPEGGVVGVEAAELPPESRAEHLSHYSKVQPVRTRLAAAAANDAIRASRELEQSRGRRIRIKARHGVVIAAGGYINNPAWLEAYGSADYSKIVRLARIGCDGSGIALGRSVGGTADLMQNVYAGIKLAPPEAFAHGILVSPEGRRFRSEEAYLSTLGNDVTNKFGGKTWLILDATLLLQALRQCMPDGTGLFTTFYAPVLLNLALGGTRWAWSIKALAKKCGMDPVALAETIDQVNRSADGSAPDPFDKSPNLRHALHRAPFVAVNLAVDNPWSFTACFSLGGLKVNEATGQVQRADGWPIPGLYAAGRSAIGLPSKSYVSGMSLADCVFSGRRAARAVSEIAGGERPAPLAASSAAPRS